MAIKLDIQNVHAGYGAVRALMGVSLELSQGQTVVLLGTNGNGKSTLMKCIMGMVKPDSGSIRLDIDGQQHDLTQMSTEDIVNLGVALVPEGRRLFPTTSISPSRPSPCSRSGASNWLVPCPVASSKCWPLLEP